MAEFYNGGTVSAENGSATLVAEAGAVWLPTNIKAGDAFFVGGTFNVVLADPVYDPVEDQYTLQLGYPYQGATGSGLPYITVKTSSEWGTNRTLALQTAELIQLYAVGVITEAQLNAAVAAAQAARDAAAASFDQIDAIYLGGKPVDPSSNNQGGGLVAGQIYFNTASLLLRLYNGTTWANMLQGQQGIQGVGAGLQFTAMTSTTDADPGGPGNLRFNNTDHVAATRLWLDNTDINNVNVAPVIDTWDDVSSTLKGQLYVWNRTNRAIFRVFNVTGAVVDKTGYREVTIAHFASNGTLANGTGVELVFIPKGEKGDTGAAGQTAGTPLTFSTTTADADPGNGFVRANNATFGAVTQLYVDNQDANAVPITTWLDSLDDVLNANARGYVRLQKPTDPSVFMEFAVVGAVVDGGGYRKVPVSPVSGAIPANATALVATFSPSGRDGNAGADGSDPGVLLNFETATADSNPTGGGLRADNAALGAATKLFVSKTNRAGNGISTFLATFDDSSNPSVKGTIILTRPADGAQAIFSVTGLTDAVGYVKVDIANNSGVAGFANNDPISLQFNRAGDQGTSGAGTGDVVGPAAAVNNRLAVFDGATGKLLKDSGALVADFASKAANGSDFADKQAVIDNISLKGANVASAATIDLDAVTGTLIHITGTVATTAVTLTSGRYRRLIADAAWPITAGPSLVLNNGGASYVCAAGDQIDVYADGTVIRLAVVPASGSTPGAMPLAYLDTDTALTANSDTKVASQKAARAYADTKIAASVLTTQGDILVRGAAAPARLAKGTQYQVLQAGATDPVYGAVNLANPAAVTGVLPAANLPDASTSAEGVSEFATAAEYRIGTDAVRSLVVDQVWAAAALAVLTDGANIAVDFAAGFSFGAASNAVLALGGDRALSAPSNLKTGQAGVLWFGASGATRILTLNAAWLLLDGVEVGPYSITTAQELGIAYVCRAARTYVTAIMRRAA